MSVLIRTLSEGVIYEDLVQDLVDNYNYSSDLLNTVFANQSTGVLEVGTVDSLTANMTRDTADDPSALVLNNWKM